MSSSDGVSPGRVLFVAGSAVATWLIPTAAYAHAGRCTAPETATTATICVVAAIVVLRPWRRNLSSITSRLRLAGTGLVIVAALTTAGCGGGGSTTSKT